MDSPTILVIDADEANRNFLAQLLHKKNFHVRQASSGEDGIRMAGEAAPSMVIFDTRLPDLKAMDLIERLQRLPAIADVPCVVLTSHSDPEAGGDGNVTKGGKTSGLSLDGKIQNVSGEKRLHLWENL